MKYFFNKNITIHRKAKISNKGDLILFDGAKLTLGRRRNKPHPHNATTLIIKSSASLQIHDQCSLFNGGVFSINSSAKVIIKSAYINEGFNININKGLQIGTGVLIGNNSFITDSNQHSLNGITKIETIVIEDNVWVGANCTLLPGAIIREGAVIAAGAVVSSEVQAYSLYGGVPAKLIKKNITWNR
ncbi:acyltransferase [Aliivibrio sifiae]|uniref:acyltransferase n=1 Tax=Aliivibrio sifiae TaxID=566293 RepID=UPI003D0FFF4B